MKDELFCGEHIIYAGTNTSLVKQNSNETQTKGEKQLHSERVRCPLDPKHTVDKHKMKKHLKICNSRDPVELHYFHKFCNTIPLEEKDKYINWELSPGPLEEIKKVAVPEANFQSSSADWKYCTLRNLKRSRLIHLDSFLFLNMKFFWTCSFSFEIFWPFFPQLLVRLRPSSAHSKVRNMENLSRSRYVVSVLSIFYYWNILTS